MSAGWGLAATTAALAIAVVRDLVALYRSRNRHASVERLAGKVPPGTYILEKDGNAEIRIVVGNPTAASTATGQGEPAA